MRSKGLGPVVRPLLGLLVLSIVATGCIASGPTYPIDIFPEMHYSPAFRSQEPPRLDPPEGAVPITGRTPRVSFAEAAQLQNPVPRTPENLQRATNLYQVNCRPCHGPNGRGDGFVAPYFRAANMRPPVDFTIQEVRDMPDGQIYAIIENGRAGMPPFGNLLSSEERWLLVHFIRSVGEGR